MFTTVFKPITYGILRFRQLRGGGLFGTNNSTDDTGKHAKFYIKLLAFLLLEIWRHKISFPEGNKSLRFDIYPLESWKTKQKSLFMPENIFSGT